MEYRQKILLLAAGILAVFAILWAVATLTAAPPAGQQNATNTSAAEALLIKAMGFGSDARDYTYSFTELTDDYRVAYAITASGNGTLVAVENPVSTKKAYFLANDSILCISYPKGSADVCSSVHGMNDTDLYMRSLKANALSNSMANINTGNMKYLLGRGYVRLDSPVTDGTAAGKQCKWISYLVDMSGISLDEAARFGISTTSPKVFSWRMCIDGATGYIYEKTFNYSVQGMQHVYDYRLDAYQPDGAQPISAPENVTEGAVKMLYNEREQQTALARCYLNQRGEDRDGCIADIALSGKNRAFCELAGPRRDRCLVSLAPVTKDTTLCAAINATSYKDDCYIELGGALKNNSWCGSIQNQSKVDFCMNVSMPKAANQSGPSVDINTFLEYVEKKNNETGNGAGNATGNTTNGTGG